MNTDAEGNLWYYYYTDFMLIRTDFKTEAEYDPQVNGADSFAVVGNGRFLIMSGGYDDANSFYVSRISAGQIGDMEPIVFVKEDGSSVPATPRALSGTKALVLTEDGNICFMDFSKVE